MGADVTCQFVKWRFTPGEFLGAMFAMMFAAANLVMALIVCWLRN